MEVLTAALAVVVLYLFGSLRIIRQYERAVTFFLGRYWGTKGPGLKVAHVLELEVSR